MYYLLIGHYKKKKIMIGFILGVVITLGVIYLVKHFKITKVVTTTTTTQSPAVKLID